MKMKMIRLICFVITMMICLPAFAEKTVNIVTLQGPTGIGMVKMMEDNNGSYQFTATSAPDEAVAAILSGNADIAAVPTNMAAILYKKTNGNVRMLALNTLGVLYILENGNEILSAEDLAGKTIYATGQGATPEYVLNYILDAYGLKDKVTVEYKAEHAELATLMSAGQVDIALLPEPHVTSVLMKNPDVHIALDVTEMFDQAAERGADRGILSMGCVIARKDFVNEHPELIDSFLKDYALSVEFVNQNPSQASQYVEKYGIMPKAAAAEKAIPNCHIVCITGSEMAEQIGPFFEILYHADPKSVGGEIPDDCLYYIPEP